MDETYSFENSIVCPVSREFAWRYWTTVSNWAFDGDVESIELHGPFVAGTHGTTISRSSGCIEWVLSDVRQGQSAVIEISLPQIVVRFHWGFEDTEAATRITQQIRIKGENARALGQLFQQGVPDGMQKLSERMHKAALDSAK